MRIILQLTPNQETVPFNYQQSLVGSFHRWLGQNELHNDLSLYSLSWLDGGKMKRNKSGLDFRQGARFCISSPLKELHRAAIDGIFKDVSIRWGMRVQEVVMKPPPDCSHEERFIAKSPILIKRSREGGKHQRYYYYHDDEAGRLMTETLRTKMARHGVEGEINIAFDRAYRHPKTKKTTFNNIEIRASSCPVIIKGDPEVIKFAWQVGVGNSTGIGFGCLR